MRRAPTFLLALSLAATAFLAGGCETTTDVLWQANGTPHHKHPTQGWWSYQFVYYPNAQVYFEPYSKTWYWCEDGHWQGVFAQRFSSQGQPLGVGP